MRTDAEVIPACVISLAVCLALYLGGVPGRAFATVLALATVYPVLFKPKRWPAFARAIPGQRAAYILHC